MEKVIGGLGEMFMELNNGVTLPVSIYDNIAYGLRPHGIKNKVQRDNIVEKLSGVLQSGTR